MKHILISCLVGVAMFEAPARSAFADDIYSRAEPETDISTTSNPDGKMVARIPLSAIRAQQGGMRLNGAEAGESVSLSIAPQANISKGRLVIRHATSLAQKNSNPHLRVEINDQFAAQLSSATGFTGALDEISLDGSLLKPGYNQFRFDALQRYTFDCQDPTASELWTDIDTQRSMLELNYTRRPFTGTLADMDAFMSAGIGGVDKLVIATGRPSEPLTRSQLRWGALATQAVANRMGYRMPTVRHAYVETTLSRVGNGPAPRLDIDATDAGQSDIILIGTIAELGDAVSLTTNDLQAGEGLVSLGPSPLDPTHFVLVLTGLDETAVERAVLSIGLGSFPFADTFETLIRPEDAPESVGASARAPLQTGVAYTFADLGLATQTFVGSSHATSKLQFELPSDFFPNEQDQVIFSLDFAYGAGLDPDSVLNVLINGIFRQALPLANPIGEAASHYELRFPARTFSPGRNVVQFDAELSKAQAGACATRNDRNLAFVLDGSSIIRLPDVEHYVELPNLARMSETGFPYSAASTQPFAIHAASATSTNFASVWMIAGRLGQMHKAIFANVDFDVSAAPGKEHTLVIGVREDFDDLLKAPLGMSPDLGGDREFGASSIRRIPLDDLGRNGLILSGENPVSPDHLLTIITAQTAPLLMDSVSNLIKPSHWSQLSGAAAVWRANPSTVVTQAATKTFFSGDVSASTRVAFENGRNPTRWVLLIGGLLFAIAVILAMIGRYMRKRTQGQI